MPTTQATTTPRDQLAPESPYGEIGITGILHPWLGALYWHHSHGQQELLGSIEIDAALRQPRLNGSRDLEILLEVDATDPAPGLQARLEECAARIRNTLTDLPSIQR